MKQVTNRESNFELLRIICMILIVVFHFSVHGGYYSENNGTLAFNSVIIDLFGLGGRLGVNIFVLISGYFLINSKFKPKKLLSLLGQVWFYSISIYLIFLLFGGINFTWESFLCNIFPVVTIRYWFITTYIGLYILSPLINKLLKKLTQKQHILLILLLILFCVSINNITGIGYDFGIIWFIALYAISTYIRLYPNKIFDNKKLIIAVIAITFCMFFFAKVFLDLVLFEMKNLTCLICAIAIFCLFKNLKIKYSPTINTIASTTFGVYLIHDNLIVRNWLWTDFLHCPEYATQEGFLIFAISTLIALYILFTFIEIMRSKLFAKMQKALQSKIEKNKANK